MKKKTEIGYAVVMFLFTLLLASIQKWSVTELVWSLWIASLVLGYAYIVTSIFGVLISGNETGLLGNKKSTKEKAPAVAMNIFFLIAMLFILGFSKITLIFSIFVMVSVVFSLNDELKEKLGLGFIPSSTSYLARFIIYLPMAAFMLGFFSIHFLMFHFVHSIFLNLFFPIIPDSLLGQNIDETGVYAFTIFQEALFRFWPFIGISALSRFDHYLKAFKASGASSMTMPYKNVVRMHLTIFAVAFMNFLKLEDFILYFIFILYFLPLKTLIGLFKRSEKSDGLNVNSLHKPIS